MSHGVEPHPLAKRLAAVRRRLRLVAGVRGFSWLVTTLVLALALAGLLDWRAHLPGVVRAVLLVATLAAAGVVAYRYLVRPLRERSDDLSLALQIESRYPELNDCLASTVQFLRDPDAIDRAGSAAMRKAAVKHALVKTETVDFGAVVDRRGVGAASLSMLAAAALGVALVLLFPAVALTALVRLAHPFGNEEWPPQTRLTDLTGKSRIARGEAFEVRGALAGVIPEKATVSFWFEGAPPQEQSCVVQKEGVEAGNLSLRLEAGRVQRSFRYRVVANDAQTPWRDVTVLPPPQLVTLDGRPSPQVRLRYPAYTDLPPIALPDGTATIDAVAGTHLTLRAATDRPIARAWMEYLPDQQATKLACFLAPFGAANVADALALTSGGQAVWGRIPARLERNDQVLSIAFRPWVAGTYALHLEDETGLGTARLFDINVWADPAPTVTLQRPSASLDNLTLLSDADLPSQLLVEDQQYAIRSVFLEYRCGKNAIAQQLALYDHLSASRTVPAVLSALAARPLPLPSATFRPRPQQLILSQRLSLKQFKHADGRPLQEGDVLTLAACADDFDDVTPDKKPGRSHEVEVRIIGRPALEALLNQNQAQIQQELMRLREQEREALKKVADAEKQLRNTGKLRPEDVENLLQAEQLQQQIRGRVGTPEEGLRAEVNKVLRTLRDNHMPRSGTQERMEMVADELERLAREELEPIEPLLTNARKENELAAEPKKPEKGKRSALDQALDHQEEVEKTLGDLLARLEPWSTTREVKGEARAILQEQRKLEAQTEKLGREIPAGRNPNAANPDEGLKAEQKAELEKASEWQSRLAEHAGQLLNKMERVAQEKERLARDKEKQARDQERLAEEARAQAQKLQKKVPDMARLLQEQAQAARREAERLREEAETLQKEAATLQKAAEAGRSKDVSGKMKQASQEVGKNQLGKAKQDQQESADALEKVAKALEDRREEELDQLIKKLREAEKEMARLVEDQDKLQKKVKEAQKIKDPAEREKELERLRREQEKLRKEAQEMAKQLTRLRADRAREALSRAGGQMDEAGQKLERGQEAEDEQEEALDRLEEAQREVQRAREEAEEELAREQLTKVADQIKRLKERQEELLPEAERLQRTALQNKRWDRALQQSLGSLRAGEEGLAQETRSLAEGKLKGALVFARILNKSADAMEQAALSIRKRLEQAKENPEIEDAAAEEASGRATQAHMRLALQRLEQLLEALKEEKGMSQRAQRQQGPMGGNGPRGGGDGIPALAQLKALKALQEEVNQRTEDFAKKHPDVTRLTDAEKKQLDVLRRDQAEVADLLQQLTPAAEEGGKP
jgi:hypothetical protein